MWVCYVDEAGCRGALPSSTSEIQPVFVLGALAVPLANVRAPTVDLLHLKRRFYPTALAKHPRFLDGVRFEIKGAEIRKDIARGSPAERRHGIGVADKVMALLRRYDARVSGRIWIKPIGGAFDGKAVYTSSVQAVCATFQHLLEQHGARGLVIADHVDPGKDSDVAMSIFTQKYRSAGDPFERMVEMPTFGQSHNHVGLQLADFICSAMMVPMAIHAYCAGHVTSSHVRPGYALIQQRFGPALRALHHRFFDESSQRRRGGLTVADPIGQRSGALLFGGVNPT